MLRSFEERLAVEVAAGVASDLTWNWPGFVYAFHQDPEELLAIVRATRANRDGDFDATEEQTANNPTESGVVEGIVGRVLACRERYSEAERLLQTFRENQAESWHSLPRTRARAAGLLALAWAGAGRLTEAQELAESADADLRTTGHDRIAPVPEVSLALGEVAWERGELEAATEYAATAMIRASDLGEVAGHSLAAILRGHIRGSRGDRSAAEAQLRQAVAMPHGRIVSPYFLERIAFERATLALQDDDLLGAELAVPDWRDRLAYGATSMREHLLYMRFVIVAGRDPTSLLEALPGGCEVTVSHRIQLGLLRALAAVAAGDERAAVDELSAQLQLAAHTGHRQRFLDERAALGAALEEAAARIGGGFFADAHTPTDHIARGGAERIELRDAKSLAETLVVFVEPLTYRELEVLRLLPSHRSYREIGAELYVSVNTVKYHVKAIYRKLGAEGRADAVRIAEHRGMVAASA
jgi:LuxR family maltose regulon positive regulatory protein